MRRFTTKGFVLSPAVDVAIHSRAVRLQPWRSSTPSYHTWRSALTRPPPFPFRLLTAFDAFDEDGSGRLDADEFREILQGTGLGGGDDGELSDVDFARVMAEVDADGSGDIDHDEVRERGGSTGDSYFQRFFFQLLPFVFFLLLLLLKQTLP